MQIKNNDKRLSVIILIQYVVLELQFILLYYFGILNTSKGNILQIVSKLIVGFLVMSCIHIILKENRMKKIIFTLMVMIIILCNLIIYGIYLNPVLNLAISIILNGYLILLLTVSIKDLKLFDEIANKISYIVFILGGLITLLIFLGKLDIGYYSTSIAYYILYPLIFFTRKFLDNSRISDLIFSILSILMVISIGSRGPLLVFVIFVLIYLIINFNNFSWIKKIVTILCILLGYTYFDKVIIVLLGVLDKFGIYSRTLIKISSGEISVSGRTTIYKDIINLINANPILGIGLAGDRRLIGVYSHNFLLEIISGFGIPFGSVIIITIFALLLRAIFISSQLNRNILLTWFAIGFIPLLFSSSYLTTFQFWILLGLVIQTNYKREN